VPSICHKKYTRPMPEGAVVFERGGERWARWTDGSGRTRAAPLAEPGDRIMLETKTWVARYRDGQGRRREVSTGCRDKASAQQVLADVVRRAEQVKAGIITPQQDSAADHAVVPIPGHIEVYLQHLRAKTVRGRRVSEKHRYNVRLQLERLVEECAYSRLRDITRESMERWMNSAEESGMGARTRNTYRAAIMAFCNWCVETDRLAASPLGRLCKADAVSDRRRTRRALTEEELHRLLKAARLRPVAEYGREKMPLPPGERKGRRTWRFQELSFEGLEVAYERGREALTGSPEFLAERERLGHERMLIYKTMVLTGLRRGELASMTVGQAYLDVAHPRLELLARDDKAGSGALIPLRADLAEDLRGWLEEKLDALRDEANAKGAPLPLRLPLDEPLFSVPANLIKSFNLDLVAAGIDKEDERGRTVDIHALRHTFGTHLSKNGVAPRTAQAAMRHSSLDLTMNVYTDPELLDVAGAVDALPDLPLQRTAEAASSTVG